MLSLDADHCKRANDTWGHQIGEAVLRLVAKYLDAQMRPSDLTAR
ncbi:diguanylate cyclase [Muricoccus pecuniae]|uniref:Diguanylate cyclase (GGDEF)-like protein n=1 Tax=Muricoccus pecuniae TaxID=693023 RepID=A0A840YF18_9PROT|nr:diguanylate cyclase [Roseomonas pecuniae]MBB5692483.1 diguanylate cyclase (GGDEF)-like protein [Roseomonas pecuniae]